MSLKILALVVARKGSKGLPGKNLANLGNRPLIKWSIEFTEMLIDEAIVSDAFLSTDSFEMARQARNTSIFCPELRPANLSGDFAKISDVAKNVLRYYETEFDKTFDYLFLLQATSPFRQINTFLKMKQIAEETGTNSVITCKLLNGVFEPYLYLASNSSGELEQVSERNLDGTHRRQDAKEIYLRTGTGYLTKTKYLFSSSKFYDSKPCFVLVDDRQSTNIDSQLDLDMARRWL